MTQGTIKWEDKYRPSKFEEVRGQDIAVRLLSGLALRHAWRPILLAGAIGSGKTTFARLFARAINCDSPNKTGSACGECEKCRLPYDETCLELNAASSAGSKERVGRILSEWNRTFQNVRCRVIFFDEAHNIAPDAQELLLTPVESPAPGVTFIFATTEPHRLKPALRSRCRPIRIEPLPLAEAIALLEHIAKAEGLSFDHEALSLIAAAKPYARDMVAGLQQVSELGNHIDQKLVKAAFDLGASDHLEQYMVAIAHGDRAAQLGAMDLWRDDEATKVRWIRLFLITTYYNDVCGQRVVPDALCYGMHQARATFTRTLGARLGRSSPTQLRTVLEGMLEFWCDHESADQVILKLNLALFGSICNRGRFAAGTSAKEGTAVNAAPVSQNSLPAPHVPELILPARDGDFINAGEVREIINRASFLIQHFGVYFDLLVTVELPMGRVTTESDAVGRLRSALDSLLVELPEGLQSHSILLLENDQGSVVGRLIAHSHCDNNAMQLAQSLAAWRLQAEHGGLIATVDTIKGEGGLAFHWRVVRQLCAGISEDAAGTSVRLLRSSLKIPKAQRREPAPLAGPRLIFGPTLSATAIGQACENGMVPLSAFDDQAWDEIYSGWEEQEYIDRCEEIKTRRNLIRNCIDRLGERSEAYVVELKAMQEWWSSLTAKERPRTWSLWR